MNVGCIPKKLMHQAALLGKWSKLLVNSLSTRDENICTRDEYRGIFKQRRS